MGKKFIIINRVYICRYVSRKVDLILCNMYIYEQKRLSNFWKTFQHYKKYVIMMKQTKISSLIVPNPFPVHLWVHLWTLKPDYWRLYVSTTTTTILGLYVFTCGYICELTTTTTTNLGRHIFTCGYICELWGQILTFLQLPQLFWVSMCSPVGTLVVSLQLSQLFWVSMCSPVGTLVFSLQLSQLFWVTFVHLWVHLWTVGPGRWRLPPGSWRYRSGSTQSLLNL